MTRVTSWMAVVVVLSWGVCRYAQAQQDLTPAGLPEFADFGWSMAFDEPFVMVGQAKAAVPDGHGGTTVSSVGCVRVYSNGVFQTTLVPDNTLYGPQSFSYSLSAAPGLLAVGAPGTSSAGNNQGGAVYVFHLQSGQWSQCACIAMTNLSFMAGLGRDVAILPDWLFAGAPWNAHGASNDVGCVYVFHRDNDQTYTQTQVLLPDPIRAYAKFGIKLAADGTTLAVASYGSPRKIYLYDLQHGLWQLSEIIESPVASYTGFGNTLALRGDRLLVGGVNNLYLPRVYVYERAAGTWGAPLTYLEPPTDYARDYFGSDLALNSQYALIMANAAAVLFHPVGTNWNQATAYNLPNGTLGGHACALSEQHFAAGAQGAHPYRGSAFLYSLAATPPGAPSDPHPIVAGVAYDPMPTQLTWLNGTGTETLDLFFGTNNPPVQQLLNNAPVTTNAALPALDYNTTYYWQVVAHNSAGTSPGPLWHFVSSASPVAFGCNPTNLYFGNVLTNTVSAPQYFSITNSGGHDLSGVIFVPPRYALSIMYDTWTNSPGPGTMAPYGVRSHSATRCCVRFMPLQSGNQDGYLRITSNDTNHPNNHVMLHGVGVKPAPAAPTVKTPADGATGQKIVDLTLHWMYGDDTESVDLYFGKSAGSMARVVHNAAGLQHYNTGHLDWGQGYYWQVVCHGEDLSTTGTVWHFTTQAEPASLQVASPNGYEHWPIGVAHEIVWAPGSDKKDVRIELMHNSGSGYTVYQTIASSAENTGSYQWTPQATVTPGPYRVRVSSLTTGTEHDSSDYDFTVTDGTLFTLTSPNGGESWAMGSAHNITWSSSGISGDVSLDLYSTLGGSTQYENSVASGITNSGTFSWRIPAGERVDNHYLIRVSSFNDQELGDFSDTNFELTALTKLAALSPPANALWSREATHRIQWQTTGPIPQVDIYLQRGSDAPIMLEKQLANTNSYAWYISTGIPVDDSYRILIYSSDDESVMARSGQFAVTPKAGTINVWKPGGGQRFEIRDSITLVWEDRDVIGPLTLELWSDGVRAMTIASNVVDTGEYDWDIKPGTPTNRSSRIRVVDSANPDTSGFSTAFDLEEQAYLKLTAPDGGEKWRLDQTHSITWASSNIGSRVRLDLYEQGAFIKTLVANTPNTGAYLWDPSDCIPGDFFRVRVSDAEHLDISDMSDGDFSLVQPLPGTPQSPTPADGTTNVPVTVVIAAEFGNYTDLCDIYLGTNNPPTTMVLTNVPVALFRVSGLDQLQPYYWKVVAKNSTGSTAGDVWQFTTQREPLKIRGIRREGGGIRVEWNPVGKISGYRLWGTTNLASGFHLLRTCTSNGVFDAEHSGNSCYYYKITAEPAE